MVDVVGVAHSMGQRIEIVHRGEHIVHDDVLGNEDVDVLADRILESLALKLLHQLAQDDAAHLALDADLGGVKVHKALHIDHAVGEDLDVLAADAQHDGHNAGVVDLSCLFAADRLARVGKDLAGIGVDNRLGQLKARDAREKRELLIELIAADVGDIIATVIEEQAVEQRFGGLHRGRIARTQTAIDLDQALVAALRGVLVEGRDDALILAEDLLETLVGDGADMAVVHAAEPLGRDVLVILTHGLEEPGDGQFAVFVDADVEDVVRIRLILQPCAVIRDDRGGVDRKHRLVRGLVEVDAGRTDDLGDDNALGAVDDKGAAGGHDREIAHKDDLLLDLLGLLVAQTNTDLERSGICGVTRLALFLGVLGLLVHRIVDEAQFQIAGVVGNGVGLLKDLAQTRLQEPLVGALLDLQKVWHVHDLLGAGKALPQSFAVENISWHWRTLLKRNCEHPGLLLKFIGPVLIKRTRYAIL